MSEVSRETPPVPEVARGVFSVGFEQAARYAELLAGEATVRGLIGPREVPRLWERHLLNCAVITEVMPDGATVADVGSGAGLPGLVCAIRRPDLRVSLIEPLLRRTTFLTEVVAELDLRNVVVHRARAEELVAGASYDVVTSRAVAPLPRLVRWCLPLVRPGGTMLAMKGSTAQAELDDARAAVRRAGGRDAAVVALGVGVVDPAVTVVQMRKS